MLRVRNPQDLGAGLMFMLIGVVGIWSGWDLTYGSARNMGPGFFPMWLSGIILSIGVLCLVRGLSFDGPAIEKIQIRPVLFVFAGALLFGYLVEYIGLFFGLILMTFVATQARKDTKMIEVALLAVAMAFISVIVFVYILGQAMPAWWGR